MDSQRLDLGWVVAGIVVLVSFVFDFVGFLECEESSLATLFFFAGTQSTHWCWVSSSKSVRFGSNFNDAAPSFPITASKQSLAWGAL